MVRTSSFLLAFLFSSTALMAETENPQICSQIDGQPGLYLVIGSGKPDRLAARANVKKNVDYRIYVVPDKAEDEEEVTVHVSVSTTAADADRNNSEATRLRRNRVASVCQYEKERMDGNDDGDDQSDETGTYIYNEFAKGSAAAQNRPLLRDWHFKWNAAKKRGTKQDCRNTAEHVELLPGERRAKKADTGSAPARGAMPTNAATRTSVLVHQQTGKRACFAFRLFKLKGDRAWPPAVTTIKYWSFNRLGERASDGNASKHIITWQ